MRNAPSERTAKAEQTRGNCGENGTRRKRIKPPTWTQEIAQDKKGVANHRRTENHGGRAGEGDGRNHNTRENDQGMEEKKRRQCPAERGSRNPDQTLTKRDKESEPREPGRRRKDKGKAINEGTPEIETTRNKFQRMANEYREYKEAFERMSEGTNRKINKEVTGNLLKKVRKLASERNEEWKYHAREFQKETNYGLMELRHKMAQKHLKHMSKRLRVAGEEKETDQVRQDDHKTAERDRGEGRRVEDGPNGTHDEDTLKWHTKNNRGRGTSKTDCAGCGEILKLHRCGVGIESKEKRTNAKDDQQTGAEKNNQWEAYLGPGASIISGGAAHTYHSEDTIDILHGISQIYVTGGERGKTFHIQLPGTQKDQYWSVVRADTKKQTINYESSRLTVPTDKLREVAAAGKINTLYQPIPTAKQPERFGIYISPRMITHAFIGPFNTETAKQITKTTQAENGEENDVRKDHKNRVATIKLEDNGEYINREQLLQWVEEELGRQGGVEDVVTMEPKTTAGVEIGETTPSNNNTTSFEKPYWLGPHSSFVQLQDPTTYQKPTGYRGTSEQMPPRTDETGRDISASQTTEEVGTPQFYRGAGKKLARSDEADVRRTTGSPTIPGCNKLLYERALGK